MSILDRYGIKEVCDVTFYAIDGAGRPTHPVLYLDTLKVSTVEQTAEQSDAKGGKGNALLMSWDFGKNVTFTLQDALFSMKSLATMNQGKPIVKGIAEHKMMRTEIFYATESTNTPSPESPTDFAGWETLFYANGKSYQKINPKFYNASGTAVNAVFEGQKYFCTFDLESKDEQIVEISADTFPGTYYITGDTFARNEANGEDEFVQLIFPKAKVQGNNTLTLEAEGDPAVFDMEIQVLRDAKGGMVKIVKYDLDGSDAEGSATSEIIHNHEVGTTKAVTVTFASIPNLENWSTPPGDYQIYYSKQDAEPIYHVAPSAEEDSEAILDLEKGHTYYVKFEEVWAENDETNIMGTDINNFTVNNATSEISIGYTNKPVTVYLTIKNPNCPGTFDYECVDDYQLPTEAEGWEKTYTLTYAGTDCDGRDSILTSQYGEFILDDGDMDEFERVWTTEVTVTE